jgi:hypothetical protein
MMQNRRSLALVLLLTIPALGGSGLAAPMAGRQPDYPFLDRTLSTSHFVVHYTLNNCGPSGNACLGSDAEAQATVDILQQAYDLLVRDPNYGFPPPLGTGTADDPKQLNVYILELDGMCGVAMWATPTPHDYFKLDAGCIRREYRARDLRTIQSTPVHELFHRVQYQYNKGPEEKWSFEGSATAVQDKFFSGLDAFPSSSYVQRANRYLRNPNRVDYDDYGGAVAGLRSASYYACLFWTYYMEACGSVRAEPARGIDALRLYWEQTLQYNNIAAMDQAVRAAPGCPDLHSMEDLFHDFIVTNYVKNMGNVSERYRYADEQGPEGTRYDDVHLEAHEAISPARPLERRGEDVAAWGVNYYVALPDAASCSWIQVNVQGVVGSRLLTNIVTTDAANNAHFYDSPAFRQRGQAVSQVIHNEGWKRVAVIVGAGDFGGHYDVEMSCVEPASAASRTVPRTPKTLHIL